MSDPIYHVIKNVSALYPRINRTYRYDTTAGKSIPCDPLADQAIYGLQFKASNAQAKELYQVMIKAFTESDRRTPKWADKLDLPFNQDEEGLFIGKASLKGAYNGELTTPPKQFDSQNTPLPVDFLLTSGSTVNLSVTLYPYGPSDKSTGGGVSLRLRAVQVIKYVPMQERSPFEVVEDGFQSAALTGSNEPSATELFPTEEIIPTPKKEPVVAAPIAEPIAEPVKKEVKKEAAPPKAEIADVLSAWADE